MVTEVTMPGRDSRRGRVRWVGGAGAEERMLQEPEAFSRRRATAPRSRRAKEKVAARVSLRKTSIESRDWMTESRKARRAGW